MQQSKSLQDLKRTIEDATADGMMSKEVSDAIIHNLSDMTLAATTEAVSPDEIDSEEVILIDFVIDASGSMEPHKEPVIEAVTAIVKDLQGYKQSDSMLVSAWSFNTDVQMLFAHKKIEDVTNDFDSYSPYGGTAMYDAVSAALTSARAYAQDLIDEDYRVRIITIVFTDGEDNSSNISASKVKKLSEAMMREEIAVHALVGFRGYDDLDAQGIAERIGFPNVMELDFSSPEAVHKSIKEMTGMLSASVIKASQTSVSDVQNSFF